MRKVGLIGCGHVGATVALDIVQGGLVDELVIIDKKREKAEAEVLDLLDALSLCRSMSKFMLENILI